MQPQRHPDLFQDIEKNRPESAKIHAENAIRKTKEHDDLLRLASRVDAMASRVQTAATMKQVMKGLNTVNGQLVKEQKNLNLETVTQIMETFEKQSGNLDIAMDAYQGAMNQTTATSTPQEDVDRLISQVADEAGVELKQQMDTATPSTVPGASEQREEELGERLRRLRA